MAATHLGHRDSTLGKFSGTDSGQGAEPVREIIARKFKFALSDEPGETEKMGNYTFRKKALFPSLLRDWVAVQYENNVEAAINWDEIKTIFVARFSEGIKFAIVWKWSIALGELAKKSKTFSIELKETIG